MPKLVLKVDDRTHEIPLTGDDLIVGRSGECDVPLPVDGLSRKHFRIFKKGLVWYVEDLGSLNGTRYESEMLGRAPRALMHGTRVLAGAAVFIYHDESSLTGASDDEESRFRSAEAPTEVHRGSADPERPTEALPQAKKRPGEVTTPTEEAHHVWVEVQTEAAAKPKIYPLGDSLTFGRADDNDVVLHDPMVSSRHCAIKAEGDTHVVGDFGTSNGTFFGRDRIRIEAAELRDRASFLIAKAVKVTYRNPELADADLPEPLILPAQAEDQAEEEATGKQETPTPPAPSSPPPPPPAGSTASTTDDFDGDGDDQPASEGESDPTERWLEVKTEAAAESRRVDVFAGMTMGRADDNDLVLHDPLVSSHHAVIESDGDALILRDMGTPNGTFLGATRDRVDSVELRDGQVLWAAKAVRMTYHEPSQANQDLPEPRVELAVPAAPESSAPPPPPPAHDALEDSDAIAAQGDSMSSRKPVVVRSGPSWKGVFLTVLFAAAVLGGSAYMLPEVIQNFMREQAAQSEERKAKAASNAVLSFERSGELGGWRIHDVYGANISAGVDTVNRFGAEGLQSLVLQPKAKQGNPEAIQLSLSTLELVGLQVQGAGMLSVSFAGKIDGNAVLNIALTGDLGRTIAIGQGALNVSESWSRQEFPVTLPREASDWGRAALTLTIKGNVERLWIDDIALRSSDGPRAARQHLRGHRLDPDLPASELRCEGNAETHYESGAGWKSLMRPVLLEGLSRTTPLGTQRELNVRDVKRPHWVFGGAEFLGQSYASNWYAPMKVGDQSASTQRRVDVSGTLLDKSVEPETYVVRYDFQGGLSGGVEYEAQLGPGDQLVFFDQDGARVDVNSAVEAKRLAAIGPISEVIAGATCIAFPLDKLVNVQIVEHQPGRNLLLRFTPDPGRMSADVEMHLSDDSRTLRALYQTVYQQMRVLRDNRRFFGSLERARFLADLDPKDYPALHQQGVDAESELSKVLERLWLQGNEALTKARSERDAGQAAIARQTFKQIEREYEGSQDAKEANKKARDASNLIQRIQAGEDLVETPEKEDPAEEVRLGGPWRGDKPEAPEDDESRANAEANARTLLEMATEFFNAGNWSMAYVFADNVAWNFHYTAAAKDAGQLVEKLAAEWRNEAKRDAWVATQMKSAASEEAAYNAKGAREIYLGILRRYPACAQKVEILERVRRLEARAR